MTKGSSITALFNAIWEIKQKGAEAVYVEIESESGRVSIKLRQGDVTLILTPQILPDLSNTLREAENKAAAWMGATREKKPKATQPQRPRARKGSHVLKDYQTFASIEEAKYEGQFVEILTMLERKNLTRKKMRDQAEKSKLSHDYYARGLHVAGLIEVVGHSRADGTGIAVTAWGITEDGLKWLEAHRPKKKSKLKAKPKKLQAKYEKRAKTIMHDKIKEEIVKAILRNNKPVTVGELTGDLEETLQQDFGVDRMLHHLKKMNAAGLINMYKVSVARKGRGGRGRYMIEKAVSDKPVTIVAGHGVVNQPKGVEHGA